MKYFVFAAFLCCFASDVFACDNGYYNLSYCSNTPPQYRVYKPQQPQQPQQSQPQQTIPQQEPSQPKPVVVPERIETPSTKTFRTKVNENLVLQVPNGMEVKSVVYVKIMTSSGDLLTVPLINNTFPVVKGNVCTYSPYGVQYSQNHYNTLVQQGYIQFGKKSTLSHVASN